MSNPQKMMWFLVAFVFLAGLYFVPAQARERLAKKLKI
jgi:hypothetical protein